MRISECGLKKRKLSCYSIRIPHSEIRIFKEAVVLAFDRFITLARSRFESLPVQNLYVASFVGDESFFLKSHRRHADARAAHAEHTRFPN